MQDPPTAKKGEYRQLRAVTMLTFLFGFALLVPYWDGSGRAVPSIGIFPLFFSAVSGALIVTGRLQLAGKIALIDSLLSMAYIAILVPRYVHEYCQSDFSVETLTISSTAVGLSSRIAATGTGLAAAKPWSACTELLS